MPADNIRAMLEAMKFLRIFQLVGQEGDDVDFGNMILSCVFCNAQRPLKAMIPFARARFRRRRWIAALSDGDTATEK